VGSKGVQVPLGLNDPVKIDTENRDSTDLNTRLKVIVVGTGRCGTLSVAHLVDEIFRREGKGRSAVHEYAARDFYDAFCLYRETGDGKHRAGIRRLVRNCNHDCIVGDGYAAVLPEFIAGCTRDVTLVHLYRADRDACIASLTQNSEMFPEAYGYYSTAPGPATRRITAAHFQEMTAEAWDRLSLHDKFAWFYDKTAALIRTCRDKVGTYVEVTMESLDDESTRRRFAKLVGAEDVTPSPVRLNAHRIDIAEVAPERRAKIQWLMGRLDLGRLANEDAYAAEYFLNQFIGWTGYQLRGEIAGISPNDVRSDAEIAESLRRFRAVIDAGQAAIAVYEKLLGERAKRESGD
jgi:hypothetical protein